MPLYHSPNLRGNVVNKNKTSIKSLMPNRLQNGNPLAYYPSKYKMLNSYIQRFSRLQADLIIKLHSEWISLSERLNGIQHNSGNSS